MSRDIGPDGCACDRKGRPYPACSHDNRGHPGAPGQPGMPATTAADILSALASTSAAATDVLVAYFLHSYRSNRAPAGEVLMQLIIAMSQRNSENMRLLTTAELTRPRIIHLGCPNPDEHRKPVDDAYLAGNGFMPGAPWAFNHEYQQTPLASEASHSKRTHLSQTALEIADPFRQRPEDDPKPTIVETK